MPQLSLYIDERTMKELETAAKIEKLSLSKFVVQKLRESMHGTWPDRYGELFGSIDDDSFHIPGEMDFSENLPRESL